MDERHDDLERVSKDCVTVIATLNGFYEDVSTTSLNSEAHRVLEHLVSKASLEHLSKCKF